GALFIIAKELGVDVKEENKDIIQDIEINVSDISLNMKNITLVGRIKNINSIRSFTKKDGTEGQVGSFLLYDATGDIRIVLWDQQANILHEEIFEKNELVKILNGNARTNQNGDIEIHIGSFGKVIPSPEDVDHSKFPKIKEEVIQIKDINLKNKSIVLEGVVIQKFPPKEFTRKNGDLGKVCSIILMDPTGTIRITFWNVDTEKVNGLEKEDAIKISGLNPRLSTLDNTTIELVASMTTNIKKIKKKINLEGEFVANIKLLQEKQNMVSFKGIISSIDNLKSITLKTGEEVSLLGFITSDNTDYIRVTLWRDIAEEFSSILSIGTGVMLKNVMVKYNTFSNRNEISFLKDSILEIIDLNIKNIKIVEPTSSKTTGYFSEGYTKIRDINSPGNYTIKGFIAKELNNITLYEACPSCCKKIDNCSCDQKENTIHRMIFNLIIDDESSTMRITFIGDIAEKIIGQDTTTILNIKETPDYEKFVEGASSELLGKDIVVRGKAKYSDFSDSYELIVYDYKEVNINEELEKVVSEIRS
ncbi:MAG: OB-fold nucleic acid binding domain-containing protein, partial [Promethearchaeota archaeon]